MPFFEIPELSSVKRDLKCTLCSDPTELGTTTNSRTVKVLPCGDSFHRECIKKHFCEVFDQVEGGVIDKICPKCHTIFPRKVDTLTIPDIDKLHVGEHQRSRASTSATIQVTAFQSINNESQVKWSAGIPRSTSVFLFSQARSISLLENTPASNFAVTSDKIPNAESKQSVEKNGILFSTTDQTGQLGGLPIRILTALGRTFANINKEVSSEVEQVSDGGLESDNHTDLSNDSDSGLEVVE